MTGIEKITDRILQDAQTEANAILAQGQEEARGIFAAYKQRAEQEVSALLARGEKELEHRRMLAESSRQMELRKAILSTKQTILAEVFSQALHRLNTLPEEELVPLLAQLAASASVTGRESVLLHPKQREDIGQAVVDAANQLLPNGQLQLGPARQEIDGGLILRDGAVDINCTFEMLLRLQRSQLSREAADILFPTT